MEPAAERAAAARANPHPTRDEVLAEIARSFSNEDPATVMAVLDEFGHEPYERERERVQRAILMLADGDVDRLLTYTQAAKRDYRDVLWWAEYPEQVQAETEALKAKFPGGVEELIARQRQPRAEPSSSIDRPRTQAPEC